MIVIVNLILNIDITISVDLTISIMLIIAFREGKKMRKALKKLWRRGVEVGYYPTVYHVAVSYRQIRSGARKERFNSSPPQPKALTLLY